MLKDMKIGSDLLEAVGVPHDLSDSAIGLWERAADDLAPTADHTEVGRWILDHAEEPAPAGGEDSP